MESSAAEGVPIKLYFDYKSPFAFLAMRPAFELPERYRLSLRWIPYLLRIKGKGERSVNSEWKVSYSCIEEGHSDHIFGVPIFVFEDEPFWGHDRIPLLEERLTERGLRR